MLRKAAIGLTLGLLLILGLVFLVGTPYGPDIATD
jgi:hypothetical protein